METILKTFSTKTRQTFLRLAAVAVVLASSFGSALFVQAAPSKPAPKPLTPATAPYNTFVPAVMTSGSSGNAAKPKIKALAVTLPPSPACVAGAGSFACDIYARTGSVALPAGSYTTPTVPIWGFAASSGGPAGLPGPVLVVTQGASVTITLHNVDIPTSVSLAISQSDMIPDTTGVTAGNSKTYTFSSGELGPGTYLYEAGLTPGGPWEAAMGLVGALVVDPSGCPAGTTCAYDANSTYVDEALLVLSELDPALNTSADPLSFDLNGYAPTFFMINGKSYPDDDNPTPQVNTSAGDALLVRYVNAGMNHHSMVMAGIHQAIVGTDAKPEANRQSLVAETVPAGGTLDTIVSVPSTVAGGTKYALYDGGMLLHNNGMGGTANANPAYTPVAFGGMLTFPTVTGNYVANGGPVPSNVSVSPSTTNGSSGVVVSATFTAAAAATVTNAELFTDLVGVSGTGLAPTTASFGTNAVTATWSISTGTLAGLTSGVHTFYVNALDSANVWGPMGAAVLTLDRTGPSVVNATVTPANTNGLSLVTDSGAVSSSTSNTVTDASKAWTANQWVGYNAHITGGTGIGQVYPIISNTATAFTVSGTFAPALDATSRYQIEGGADLRATATDESTGHQPVTTAEYFIDTTGANGTGIALSFTPTAPVVYMEGTISPTTIAGLPEGAHSILIHAQDALGNWGAYTNVTLTVDRTGPTSSNLVLNPNPTNGQFGIQVGSLVEYFQIVSATHTDPSAGGVHSNIQAAEFFIDTVAANGTGSIMVSTNGAFGTNTVNTYQAIPLYEILALSQGPHTFYVHAQDSAGNWGPMVTATLIVDKTGPAATITGLAPNPTLGAAASTLTLSATDPVNGASPASTVNAAEAFLGQDPGAGSGTAMTLVGAPGTTSAFSANLPVTGLSFNSYLIAARARDAAMNWGSAALRAWSVLPADGIFADGFELGSTSAWSAVTGAAALSVFPSAATGGTVANNTQGLIATVTAGASGSVTYTDPASENAFHARFYFNPNGIASTAAHDLLIARSSTNAVVFRIQYRTILGISQVQAVVTSGATTKASGWFVIAGFSGTSIEAAWSAGASTTFTLYLNGTAHTVTAVNSSALNVKSVQLGPQGAAAAVNGTEYFDSFVATRTTLIGQ